MIQKALKVLVLIVLAFQTLAAAQVHFSRVVTSSNMSVIFTTAPTVNGAAIQAGDEIGAFKSDSTTCTGALLWSTDPTKWQIAVMGADVTPPLPGMDANEAVIWKIWKASTNSEVVATATYTAGDGLYESNDMQVISALTGGDAGLLGDVNGDDLVNSTDALIILTCDADYDVSSFCPMNCGDVNADGLVNSTDALILLSYDAGYSIPFPVGQPNCPASVTPCPGCN